jgi:DNA-directed RNA polymerase subunit RPC12/RpoP
MNGNGFVCQKCGAAWLSPPAQVLVSEAGGRCLRCGEGLAETIERDED